MGGKTGLKWGVTRHTKARRRDRKSKYIKEIKTSPERRRKTPGNALH